MCHPYYPAPGADIFGELQKGSVIVLYQGAGKPTVEDVSTSEVILTVDKFSALTNTGRLLCCTDSPLLKAYGTLLADGEYEIAYAGKRYAITTTGIFLTEADCLGVFLRQEIRPAGFYISAKARQTGGCRATILCAIYLYRFPLSRE